jgi:hypothetical protein
MFAHAFAATRKALLHAPPPRPDTTTDQGAHRGNVPAASQTRP